MQGRKGKPGSEICMSAAGIAFVLFFANDVYMLALQTKTYLLPAPVPRDLIRLESTLINKINHDSERVHVVPYYPPILMPQQPKKYITVRGYDFL